MDLEQSDRELEADMPKHIHEHMGKHRRMFGPDMTYWAGWRSPVGLGIFFLTTALAAAVALYTILNLISGVMALSHPAQSYSYPSTTQMPAESQGSLQ